MTNSFLKSTYQLGDLVATLEHPADTLPPHQLWLGVPGDGPLVGRTLLWTQYVEPVKVYRIRSAEGRIVTSICDDRGMAERFAGHVPGRTVEEVTS